MSEGDIQQLKMKRILDSLDSAAGEGTSLITLLISSGGNASKTKQKLVCEESAASQIKSRV
jgi:peptide subunit release factor 1 (eRF1)